MLPFSHRWRTKLERQYQLQIKQPQLLELLQLELFKTIRKESFATYNVRLNLIKVNQPIHSRLIPALLPERIRRMNMKDIQETDRNARNSY